MARDCLARKKPCRSPGCHTHIRLEEEAACNTWNVAFRILISGSHLFRDGSGSILDGSRQVTGKWP